MDDDGNKHLDLDKILDLESAATRPPAAAPRRFQPKLKGKIKAEPAASLPLSNPVKKQDDDHHAAPSAPTVKAKEDDLPSASTPCASGSGDGAAAAGTSDVMEVDEKYEGKEDTVVDEIDVFFNPGPLDEDTWLYVMQYPLRPAWRPYEEECLEVKVKPKQKKVEVDLRIDVNSENYDQERPDSLKFQKLTLSSTKVPFVTSYAVGVLKDKKVHLNPLHAIVQLRPSTGRVNVDQQKHAASTSESSTRINDGESAKAKQVPVGSNNNDEDAEPWISLKYEAMDLSHGEKDTDLFKEKEVDSQFADMYHHKMVTQPEDLIEFTMKSSNYLNSLCQGMSTDIKRTKVPPRKLLLSMPLEERLKKWLSKVAHVNRFNALMHLAPEISEEDLLKVLVLHADLVQGLWVTKSSLLYEGKVSQLRDKILCFFSKNPVVHMDKLKGIPADVLRHLMSPLARERIAFKDWKFKEATDFSFIKRYPDIVKEQECAWSSYEKNNLGSIPGSRRNMALKDSENRGMAKRMDPGKVDPDASTSKGGLSSTSTTMSQETREDLRKVLSKIFQEKRVRSFNSIIRGLRELAINISSHPKHDSKNQKYVDAAKIAVSAPSELQSVLSQDAVDIHGLYVLKSLGNAALDPLRNVVIGLFRGKEPNAKLTKQEIRTATKISLNKDITDSEYNQVMHELCISNRGSWILKNGD